MKHYRLILLLAVVGFIATRCYMPIEGQVVDAETNQPIEGAVVLVEWTKTKGFGFTHTESYKMAEVLSDKDGKFELPGCYSPFVNTPHLTVYKKGYVAWSNRWIFPSWQKRTDFGWRDNIYELSHFKEGTSYIDHTNFIASSIASASQVQL